ncbi:hypothetical protein BCR39DRAFT_537845 [Naematelia encephala]|uniref:Uncharacterized protein n=1 Tax=Naematelia encephala TaxID=71784 RepID=A0A1Y2AZE7_9TREE|nr:hypothetical protein BCR39DRAFT_537845 [Naematelia encephala]
MSPSDNSSHTPAKRVAPISASAFAFTLNASSSKKPKPPLAPPTSFAAGTSSKLAETSIKSEPNVEAQATPRKTLFQTLDALPTPIVPRPQHRISSVFGSPSALKTPSKSKIKEENTEVARALRPVGDLRGGISVEQLGKRTGQVKEEHEGVGVSPSKHKGGLKWSGKGPLPPSMQLQRLLQSHTSSTLLFYTSTHRSLFGPASVRRMLDNSKLHPTAIEHLRTAPLVLEILSIIPGVSQNGLMAHSCVLVERAALTLVPEESSSDRSAIEAAPIVVIFESVPAESPRLGMDPRLLSTKIESGMPSRQFQAGVWAPWSEVTLPIVADVNLPSRVGQSCKALFVSRYLIAEAMV